MFCRLNRERLIRQLLLLAVLGGMALAVRAFPGVADFGSNSWQEVQKDLRRPTAFVFSSTDCVHCPKVIAALADAAGRSHGRSGLALVVMDGQGQEKVLQRHPLYRRANALYVFNGEELALRYSVNPAWRGLTPYVVLLEPGAPARYFTGMPPAEDVQRFFR